MRRLVVFVYAVLLHGSLFAQDDLLQMLEKENPKVPVPVLATFKTTRIVTGQSTEQVAAKHLNFVILHRFGEFGMGANGLWGLDQANMRLVFDYGLTDRIQLGVARSSIGKTIDGNLKLRLLRQAKGGSPVSLSYYGNTGIGTEPWADPTRKNYFTSRMTFFGQLLLARKFGERMSLQLAPCFAHKNLVTYVKDENTVFALGMGGSFRLSRSMRFNVEYMPRLTGKSMKSLSGGDFYDYLACGLDIETGGHVFQLTLSNGSGMLEQHALRETTTSWTSQGMRLGFNISRTFSFDKKQEKKKW